MAISLIVGGKSEAIFISKNIHQIHPSFSLDGLDIRIIDAGGDSKIPEISEREIAEGRKVVVLFDSDAMHRKGEQSAILSNELIDYHKLDTDFEGSFDAEVVQLALREMGLVASLDCLRRAIAPYTPFANLEKCITDAKDGSRIDKASLAASLATTAARYSYIPQNFDTIFRNIGRLMGLADRHSDDQWLMTSPPPEATGKLFVSNHVSNHEIRFWDFDNGKSGTIPLPAKVDSLITPCKRGTQFYTRKYVRGDDGMPKWTWVYSYNLVNTSLSLKHQFKIPGSVYELLADEDGQHVELRIQIENNKTVVRCLNDGTQQKEMAAQGVDGLYASKTSRNGRLVASGPRPMVVTKDGTPITVFPHFYSHSYTWSKDQRFLAFFARRWKNGPDFMWIYDIARDMVHKCAVGEQFIPIYWTS